MCKDRQLTNKKRFCSMAQLRASLSCNIEVPPALDQVAPELLAGQIQDGKSVVVVDVRTPEEYEKGHIAGSKNIPLDDLDVDTAVAELIATGVESIVFVSLQSPDIDQAAALSFSSKLAETDGPKPTVSILLGGVLYWFQLYSKEANLTAAYDEEHWSSAIQAGKI
jgi:rhodanese-related sulfurtransferase